MKYSIPLIFLFLAFPLMAQEETLPVSEYQQCLTSVRARGGDAWAARVITLTHEDCCPAQFDERDIYRWCDPN